MKEYTHIAGGVLFFLIFAYILDLNYIISGMIFAGWISIFPDVIERMIWKHQTIGHSLIWIIPFIIISYFNLVIGVALITGFLSHLFFDMFTINGCRIFYPILNTTFVVLRKSIRVHANTNQEKAVFIFLIFLIVPLFVLTTGISTIPDLHGYTNTFNQNADSINPTHTNKNYPESKNTFYINLDLNSKSNKNITVHKVDENFTNIEVKDIGG